MLKKCGILVVLCCLLWSLSGMASASQFISVGNYSLKDMGDSKSWSHVYRVGEGEFKIKISKLAKANVNQKYHLKVWKDGKLVSDAYCPGLGGYYEIQVFEDKATGKFFFTLNTESLSRVFAYNSNVNKFCVLTDSRKCPGKERYPKFFITKSGDLELFYTGTDEYAARYLLSYNSSSNKMTARNTTKERPKPVVVEQTPVQSPKPVYYDPEPEYNTYDYSDNYDITYNPAVYEEEDEEDFTSNNVIDF